MKWPAHREFYDWLKEKGYDSDFYNWNPDNWDPEGNSFSKDCSSGYERFIEIHRDDPNYSIDWLVYEFFPKFEVSEFVKEVVSEAKRYFTLGWRKCYLAGRITQQDENDILELFRFVKKWEKIEGEISFKTYSDRFGEKRVVDLSLRKVPDHIPPIQADYYCQEAGWRYDIPRLLLCSFGNHFWVKFNNPELIPAPMVSFIGGVIMAIPEFMIPAEFQQLTSRTEKYLGQIKTKEE
jgi:hypothetical protein